MKLRQLILLLLLALVGCSSVPDLFGPTPRPPTKIITAAPTATKPATATRESPTGTVPALPGATDVPSTPAAEMLWVSPAVPEALALEAQNSGIPLSIDASSATVSLDISSGDGAVWIYALVAPFPTVTDGVTLDDIRNTWNGSPTGPFAGRELRMAESTRAAFSALWGEPTSGSVLTVASSQLLQNVWTASPSWAIIPFEEIQPKWKVLTVDGQSPLRKDFNASEYPLKVNFGFSSFSFQPSAFILPPSNRDPSKLTTVIVTGVTALVRAAAQTMNVKGVLYPGEEVRAVMRQADIAHVSNEIPFYGGCPDPDINDHRLVFCSPTRYIDLLTDIGTDVVELTGNHFADYGPGAMRETLALYRSKNISYFGGGADLLDARKPLLLENHGNKIAFIGCNYPDRGNFPTATEERPGAAPCDFDYMTAQISQLRAQGYLPIATFQYTESDEILPYDPQITDFRKMADAGAVVVSGSQAHTPQTMEFYNDAFVHYGLGNLFFDQMGDRGVDSPKRREFLDRHVFYDGRYLGVELLSYVLEDYCRPRAMTLDERIRLLTDYFGYSGW